MSYNTPVPEQVTLYTVYNILMTILTSGLHGQVALMNHYRDCEGLHYGYADLGPPVLDNRRRADRSVILKFCYDGKN